MSYRPVHAKTRSAVSSAHTGCGHEYADEDLIETNKERSSSEARRAKRVGLLLIELSERVGGKKQPATETEMFGC